MEIRKGSAPPIIQKQNVDSEVKKGPETSTKTSVNIPDSIEAAPPPSKFQELEKQALQNFDPSSGKNVGGPDFTEDPEDLRIGKQPDLSHLLKKDDTQPSPLLNAIVNTERLGLQDRLQDAMDATLPLRMKQAGASATDIAAALQAQGQSAEDVAKTLKALGFSGEEVAVALRNEYQLMPTQLAETMKEAGFSATEIAKGLKEAWSQDSGQVRDILEALGYTQQQIADAMWGAFQIGEFTTLD